MRVFVTGATGWVGSAVVQDLLLAGHTVTGLAHTDEGALKLEALGVAVHRGDLEDLDSLRRGADASDGVIHTAFIHDFSRFKEVCEADRRAIEALGAALKGSGRPLVVTSGFPVQKDGHRVTEDDVVPDDHPVPRVSEQTGRRMADLGVPTAVVRLPTTVHGLGDKGFIPMLAALARQKGVAAYIGEGANRWPAVHRLDAAPLFRKALERAAPWAIVHAAAEGGVPLREVAEAIGKSLGLPVASIGTTAVQEHFGWMAMFAGMDLPVSAERTHRDFEWNPSQPKLLEDLERSDYFKV